MLSIRGTPSVLIASGPQLTRKSGAACPRAAAVRSIAGPEGPRAPAVSLTAGAAPLRVAGFQAPAGPEDPRAAAVRRLAGAAPLRAADPSDLGRTGTPAHGGILWGTRTGILPRGRISQGIRTRYRLISNQIPTFLRFPAPSGGAASTTPAGQENRRTPNRKTSHHGIQRNTEKLHRRRRPR